MRSCLFSVFLLLAASPAGARDLASECADAISVMKTASQVIAANQKWLDDTKAALASRTLEKSQALDQEVLKHADANIAAVENYLLSLKFVYTNRCLPASYDVQLKAKIEDTTSALSDLKDERQQVQNMSKYLAQ
jgi:hypothetical protein